MCLCFLPNKCHLVCWLKVSYGFVSCPHGPSTSSPPQEPTGEPVPKRPRGRPKGSKNKGPSKAAQKVRTRQLIARLNSKKTDSDLSYILCIVLYVYPTGKLFYPSIYHSIYHVPLHKKRNINLGSVN